MNPIATRPSKALSIGLWVAQVLLAFAFGAAGAGKLFNTADFASKMGASADLVRFIGAAELAGAIGVVLPAATRIKPVLTPVAAVGLAVVMVLAIAYHLSRGENDAIVAPIVLGALAVFVAWGRFRAAPIAERKVS